MAMLSPTPSSQRPTYATPVRASSCTDVIKFLQIYYCSIFFNERATTALCSGTTVASRSIRGGTTLHELTHAVADTDDVTYGCSADQALSDANSVRNADNYNVRAYHFAISGGLSARFSASQPRCTLTLSVKSGLRKHISYKRVNGSKFEHCHHF